MPGFWLPVRSGTAARSATHGAARAGSRRPGSGGWPVRRALVHRSWRGTRGRRGAGRCGDRSRGGAGSRPGAGARRGAASRPGDGVAEDLGGRVRVPACRGDAAARVLRAGGRGRGAGQRRRPTAAGGGAAVSGQHVLSAGRGDHRAVQAPGRGRCRAATGSVPSAIAASLGRSVRSPGSTAGPVCACSPPRCWPRTRSCPFAGGAAGRSGRSRPRSSAARWS